jgi:exopolysaccharide biosynthesis WecB/TagA/CpsF family protein
MKLSIDQYKLQLVGTPLNSPIAVPVKSSLSYNVVSMASGLLLLLDLLCVLLAGSFSTLLYHHWFSLFVSDGQFRHEINQAVLVAAVLAPFILYDQGFGPVASRGKLSALLRIHFFHFTIYSGVVLTLSTVSHALQDFAAIWLVLWFSIGLLLTTLTRVLMAQLLRNLQRRGILTEVIAIVGKGPVADRLVQTLRQTPAESIELLGVFDDKIICAQHSMIQSSGNLAQLIELGKIRKIDWILLTLPATAEQRVLSIVQRLKALSVSIGLCPAHVGLTVPHRTINYIGDNLPVCLLADCPQQHWNAMLRGGENFFPRWIITIIVVPLVAMKTLAKSLLKLIPGKSPHADENLSLQFDNYDLAEFTEVAAHFGQDRYGYVVTPNVDHLIRLQEDATFRALYAAANYTLLDSRFLAHLLHLTKGIQLPVCTGSDLTANLFSGVISPDDSLVLIGCRDVQVQQLRERYGLRNLSHYNPPMGFIQSPEAVEACLRFIESHSPFRFCLLAVGAPQQEVIAHQLKARGIARGMALCIGASINFLTGDERRAPLWMQRSGMEWCYRLLQAPGRMAKRYLVRGPRIFTILKHTDIVLRQISTPPVPLTAVARLPALPKITLSNQAVVPMVNATEPTHDLTPVTHLKNGNRSSNAAI